MIKKRNVLLLPENEPSFKELFILAKYIKADTGYEPLLILYTPKMLNYKDKLTDAGIGYVGIPAGSFFGKSKKPAYAFINRMAGYIRDNSFFKGLYLNAKVSMPMAYLRYVFAKKALEGQINLAERIVEKYNPAALFLYCDRGFSLGMAMIKSCRSRNIKTILVPVALSSGGSDVVLTRLGKIDHSAEGFFAPIMNLYAAKKYPGNVSNFYHKKVLFYPAALTMALARKGMLPENPWCLGGGYSDYVCVEDGFVKNRCVEYGLPKDKIAITGRASYDILISNIKNREGTRKTLVKKYGFDPAAGIILCSAPQLAEHNMMSWERHWKETEFLIKTLCDTKQNVLVSLHPRSDYDSYKFLEKKYNCRVALEPCIDIIACADIFVATFSSTILWSVICNIPSIAVDFYGLDYDIFDELKSVITLKDKSQLAPILEKIINDKDFLNEVKIKQKEVMRNIPTFDGGACRRMAELVEVK